MKKTVSEIIYGSLKWIIKNIYFSDINKFILTYCNEVCEHQVSSIRGYGYKLKKDSNNYS